MFAPIAGRGMGLNFFETYFSIVAGGIAAATVFFFSAEYFMIRAHKKRKTKILKFKEQGLEYNPKKSFTKTNKFVVRIKKTFGQIGISLWAPLFLSVPIGSVVAAKFYGKSKKTFPLIILGMFVNGFITTSLSYLF